MRHTKSLVLLTGLTLSLAAWAQPNGAASGDPPKSPLLFDVAGGATFPSGAAAPRFDPGWNIKAGVGANLTQWAAIVGEYFFSSLGVDSKLLGSNLSGRQYVHSFGVSGMFSMGRNRGVSVYLIGGPAAFYRKITISEYAGTAVAPYCDPYFFYCYSVPVSVSNVIGSRSEWDFGLDGGLGVQFGFGTGDPHLFLEGRYQYVFGHSYGSGSRSVNSSSGFIPVVLGFRW